MHQILLVTLLSLPVLSAADTPPGQPPAEEPVAGEYQALMDEYRSALKKSDAVFVKATTEEQRQQIRADFAKVNSKFIIRFLAYAETHAREKEALLALFFVLHPDSHAERGDADKALQFVRKDHIQSDRLTNPPILQFLAWENSPSTEKLLRDVLANNPHHVIQANACFSLAQVLKNRANASPPEQAAKLANEADGFFKQVVDRYADVKELAAKAGSERFERRRLQVGKVVPDIEGEDLGGTKFRLSDTRGKVTVLVFWASWCPPCMRMIPHERELAERLKDQPFALVGVNGDGDRAAAKKAAEKEKMGWRSFHDGTRDGEGATATAWNVHRWPMIYILDGKGVIRYKGIREVELDKAVDQLLADLK
jgi:thiol-disulfide isomerase/thioredoxin